MQDYTTKPVEEALDRARLGERVLIVGSSNVGISTMFEKARAAAGDASRIRTTNGNQQISFADGGTVWFMTARSARYRGMVLDAVYVHADADRDLIANLYPCLNSTGGPLFGYPNQY